MEKNQKSKENKQSQNNQQTHSDFENFLKINACLNLNFSSLRNQQKREQKIKKEFASYNFTLYLFQFKKNKLSHKKIRVKEKQANKKNNQQIKNIYFTIRKTQQVDRSIKSINHFHSLLIPFLFKIPSFFIKKRNLITNITNTNNQTRKHKRVRKATCQISIAAGLNQIQPIQVQTKTLNFIFPTNRLFSSR
ncbi:hypothetical protein ABPG72_012067 [Tetrahymena utriculariae]